MNVSLSAPKNYTANLLIGDKTYKLRDLEGNLAYDLIHVGLLDITWDEYFSTEFPIDFPDEPCTILSNSETTTIDFKGNTDSFPVPMDKFLTQIAKDIHEHAEEWMTPLNYHYYKKRVSEIELKKMKKTWKDNTEKLKDNCERLIEVVEEWNKRYQLN